MSDLSLKYIIRKSSIQEGLSPLILLLHGHGSDEKDLFSFADDLPKNAIVMSVQAPIPLDFGGYTWFTIHFDAEQGKFSDPDEGKDAIKKLNLFLDETLKKYEIDKDNISLIGFSQGAILSYAFSFTFPNKVKNVVALSGYFHSDFLTNPPIKNDIDYFISHGKYDEIIPIDWARNTSDFLNELEIKYTYKEYSCGHQIPLDNFHDFKNWIEKRI